MRRIRHDDPAAVALFWDTLRSGGVVAYPTDTLYGLGADATDERAVGRVILLKGRPGPYSVMLGSANQLPEYASVSAAVADKLFAMVPGPYTFLLHPVDPARFAPQVVGPGLRVGFRIPLQPFIQRAYRGSALPVVTTSINHTGHTPLTDPREIEETFGDQIDLLIDAGPLPPSKGSTIVDATVTPWQVTRPGEGGL